MLSADKGICGDTNAASDRGVSRTGFIGLALRPPRSSPPRSATAATVRPSPELVGKFRAEGPRRAVEPDPTVGRTRAARADERRLRLAGGVDVVGLVRQVSAE